MQGFYCNYLDLKNYGVETWEQLKKLLPEFPKQPKVLDDLSLDGVAKFIKENKAKKIIVMTGAGVSTCNSLFFLLCCLLHFSELL